MSDCVVDTAVDMNLNAETIKANAINVRTITDKDFYGHKACARLRWKHRRQADHEGFRGKDLYRGPCRLHFCGGFHVSAAMFYQQCPNLHFCGTASMMSGIAAGAKALGLKDFHVLGIAGDGGTADIGLQALSGAIDRRDKVIFVCYDNEAYMNTGIQKSGLTPLGAKTTTTPAGKNIRGSQTRKKNMFEIVAANGIDYAATASVGYIPDFLNKINKAKSVDGTSYIHVFAPCPTGWGTPTDSTIDLGKDVVDCGLWYLAEYENGEFILNKNPKDFTSVKDYLFRQGRFRHLKDEDIEQIIRDRDRKWKVIRKSWKTK